MTRQRVTTTSCSKWQHLEFHVEFESGIPAVDIEALVSFLEATVKAGTRYAEGELIAFGSMILRVAEMENALTLQEPDLQSIPISWNDGITQSMMLLRLQKDVGESIGLEDELDPPSIRSSLLVGADLSKRLGGCILERSEPAEADSGWFVGRLDTELDYSDEANLQRISVYQAILNWPNIAGFLALPAGCRVEVSGASRVFSRNGQVLEIQERSFLDMVQDRRPHS